MMEKKFLAITLVVTAAILLISCSTTKMNSPNRSAIAWQSNPATIWDRLQQTSSKKLVAMQNSTTDGAKLAWFKLALISKDQQADTKALTQKLLAWRKVNPDHPGNQLLPKTTDLVQLRYSRSPKRIAVLLPESGMYASSGKAVREGFLSAYYANLSNTRNQSIRFYDTQGRSIRAVYKKALADGADFIVGPLLKDQVQQLVRIPLSVPMLALNYTERRFQGLPKNFYEFGLLPEDEISQVVYKAIENGHTRALVIAPENAWGARLMKAFKKNWAASGGTIPATLVYKSNTDFNQEIANFLKVTPATDTKLMHENNNKYVLEQQRRQDFDSVFLFAQPQNARVIIPLLRYYYVSQVPIYSTSAIYTGKSQQAKDVDLNGVIVCDIPWKPLNNIPDVKSNRTSERLFAVGQDAYRISQTFNRVVKLPSMPLYGNTGSLSMHAQQVHRRTPCQPLSNGHLG